MKEDKNRTAGPVIKARSKGIRVEIPKNLMERMQGWCDAAHSEVSGYGLVDLIDGVFKVSNVYLPEQYCSSGYTLIKEDSKARLDAFLNAKYMEDLQRRILAGDLTVMEDPPTARLGFWWHTHYNFGVGWSGTDDNQAQYLAEQRRNGAGWSLSLVINQAHDRLCRADFVSPVGLMVDNLTIVETPSILGLGKRDYDWDIRRWVKPMVYERSKTIIEPKWLTAKREGKTMLMGSKYIVFKGQLMTLSQYACAIECTTCQTGTCPDCVETMRASNE